MKYIAILFLVISGCASAPSQYVQGCEDGVSSFIIEMYPHLGVNDKFVEQGCNNLEALKKSEQAARNGENRPGGRSNK